LNQILKPNYQSCINKSNPFGYLGICFKKGTAPQGGRYARDYSSQADKKILTEITI